MYISSLDYFSKYFIFKTKINYFLYISYKENSFLVTLIKIRKLFILKINEFIYKYYYK
jgi:hypothetical protein